MENWHNTICGAELWILVDLSSSLQHQVFTGLKKEVVYWVTSFLNFLNFFFFVITTTSNNHRENIQTVGTWSEALYGKGCSLWTCCQRGYRLTVSVHLVTGAEGLAEASAGVHIVLPFEPTAWLWIVWAFSHSREILGSRSHAWEWW